MQRFIPCGGKAAVFYLSHFSARHAVRMHAVLVAPAIYSIIFMHAEMCLEGPTSGCEDTHILKPYQRIPKSPERPKRGGTVQVHLAHQRRSDLLL